ncbi:VOC family protein [Pedobacter sp. G11]|uniref:VOC family protein n=1 Tax=Pedobacter sp. G11 TaxID=2482728 RepID=UPI000F5EB57E|nr:VOC family protein [Pedobacter sp. G11]AZI25685.1 VOC family protein [Pedobacter sp. G11]
MASINSYLTFNGNCKEAMRFYQDCLGGELTLQSIGESAMAGDMPQIMADKILHAVLIVNDIVIMGTDMIDDSGLVSGNTVALMLNCDTALESKVCYERLARGGKASHPLRETFWGSLFGNLVDRYGNNWLINYDKKFL